MLIQTGGGRGVDHIEARRRRRKRRRRIFSVGRALVLNDPPA
jgi:hypothetical protein